MFIFDKTDAVRGKFLNKVITAWEGNRDMVLHSPFSYRDSNGKLWTAPARAKINGASIPRLLWVLVGPPYVGLYRQASVIHDHYCEARTETWQETHWVFYDGCLAAGMPRYKALLMYATLYVFGDTWLSPHEDLDGLEGLGKA
jgi:hypothetical protein